MKRSLRKFSFLLKRDKLGEACSFLSLVVAVWGGDMSDGNDSVARRDKLREIYEKNGKIVSF